MPTVGRFARVARAPLSWPLLALICSSLVGCGGGGDAVGAADPSAVPVGAAAGPMGAVTAVPTGIWLPGDYAISDCRLISDTGTFTAVGGRTLRLKADGGLQWLDQQQAVLVDLVADPSKRQFRYVDVGDKRSSVNGFTFEEFEPGPVDGSTMTKGVVAQLTRGLEVFWLDVRTGATLREVCSSGYEALRGRMASSAAILARAGSAVSANGLQALSGPVIGEYSDSDDMAFASLAASGQVITQSNVASPVVEWGMDWLADALAAPDGSSNTRYAEWWDTSEQALDGTRGGPADPRIQLAMVRNGAFVAIHRDSAGAGIVLGYE